MNNNYRTDYNLYIILITIDRMSKDIFARSTKHTNIVRMKTKKGAARTT